MESTAPKPFVFVLMPFGPEFDDVYQLGIKAACQEAGTYCERLDEQIFHENMLERIYNQISKADIIVADMSGKNLNVFYEVGYAHALNKVVVLLTANAEDIPFDFKHYPHVVYSGKITHLKEQLYKKISYFLQSNIRTASESREGFQIYINDAIVEDGHIYQTTGWQGIRPYFNLKIQNKSNRSFEPDDYKLSFLAPKELDLEISRYWSESHVFKDTSIVYYSFDNRILPMQWLDYNVSVAPKEEEKTKPVCEIEFSILCIQHTRKVTFKIAIDAPVEIAPF